MGQLPVITGHTRKCLAAKQKGASEGISSSVHATQIEFLHLVVVPLDLSSSEGVLLKSHLQSNKNNPKKAP